MSTILTHEEMCRYAKQMLDAAEVCTNHEVAVFLRLHADLNNQDILRAVAQMGMDATQTLEKMRAKYNESLPEERIHMQGSLVSAKLAQVGSYTLGSGALIARFGTMGGGK